MQENSPNQVFHKQAHDDLGQRFSSWLRSSITIRLLVIGFLILILLIPVTLVQNLISERQLRQEGAIREVSAKWGRAQTVKGPIITVPYSVISKVFDKKQGGYRVHTERKYAHFLPKNLQITGSVKPKVLHRGIYDVVVYSSQLQIKGSFSAISFAQWKSINTIHWDEAHVSLGISDLRTIQKKVQITLGGKSYTFDPGVESADVITSGIKTRIALAAEDRAGKQFSIKLRFNGSMALHFIPLGEETDIKLTSDWQNPSFAGAFLPDRRDVSDRGFSAHWNVLHLNRGFPQKFVGAVKGVDETSFGVNLRMPVDQYQKSMRSAKYAVLLIALTFLVFFFIQLFNKIRIHPIQYLLVGLGLTIFYTLLLSLSEHLGFEMAYLGASLAIIVMITGYARVMLKNLKLTLIMGLTLVVLYAFIYTITQLQDYALLMGSVGLFVVLAIIMFLSRKIDWYAVSGRPDQGLAAK